MLNSRMLSLCALILAMGCASPPNAAQTTEADVATLHRLITEDWPAAARAADTALYVGFLTDDFAVMPPSANTIRSKPELAKWLQGAFASATFDITFDPPEEINVLGDWAYARYHVMIVAHPKAGGAAIHMDRKYMDVWRRQPDGKWKCHRHMWNDNPVPGTDG